MFGRKKKKFANVDFKDYVIREITEKDWIEFKKLYLKALKSAPTMFEEAYNDQKKKGDEYWRNEIKEYHDDTRSLLCGIEHKASNKLVGILRVRGHADSKLSHLASMSGLYLLSDHQSPELEKRVIQLILKHFKQFTDISKLQTAIITDNVEQMQLFNQMGFVRYGYDEKHYKIGRSFYDSILLAKVL